MVRRELPGLLVVLAAVAPWRAGSTHGWCSPDGQGNLPTVCPCGIPCICDGCTVAERAAGKPCTHWPLPVNPHQNSETNTSCKCPDPHPPTPCVEPSCDCPKLWFCDANGEHPPASQGGTPHTCKLTRGVPRNDCPDCVEFTTLQECMSACNGTKPPPPPPPPLSTNP
jgi:hypothetical protein